VIFRKDGVFVFCVTRLGALIGNATERTGKRPGENTDATSAWRVQIVDDVLDLTGVRIAESAGQAGGERSARRQRSTMGGDSRACNIARCRKEKLVETVAGRGGHSSA